MPPPPRSLATRPRVPITPISQVPADSSVRLAALALALVCTTIAIFGSIAPGRFVVYDWRQAIDSFSQLPFLQPRVKPDIDAVSNLLFFLPLGFFWTAAAVGSRPRWLGWSVIQGIGAVVWCTLLGAVIEFAQFWFPNRTVSPLDVQAQLMGTIIGALAWLVFGWRRSGWLAGLIGERSNWVWFVVLVLWFLGMTAPLDVTISPRELLAKRREGKLEIRPFSRQPARDPATWLGLGVCGLAAIPVGAAMVTLGRGREQKLRSAWAAGVLAVMVIAVGELAQLPVRSRSASSLDAAGALAGALVGVLLRRRLLGPGGWSVATEELPLVRGFGVLCVWGIAAAGTAVAFWWPLRPSRKRLEIYEQLDLFQSRPLFDWLQAPQGLDFSVKGKLLFPGLLGLICGLGWRYAFARSKPRTLEGVLLSLLLCCGTSAVLELGQTIFPPHSPDRTDLLFSCGFAGLGLTAGLLAGLLFRTRSVQLDEPRIEPKKLQWQGGANQKRIGQKSP